MADSETAAARPIKIICVVGARPNFMKIAPIMRALAERPGIFEPLLVHTGQHYDVAMNERFFQQLRIPNPDISLEVGSGSHAVQTAEVMKRFEPVLDREAPDIVLVVGDVNSTLACALVAAKKGVMVVHVEAGLRSRDRSMPEEINRILTDQLSDRLYVTEEDAITNLLAEGIPNTKIKFVGNVMIDTLLSSLQEAVPPQITIAKALQGDQYQSQRMALESPYSYGLVTIHRPSNVDARETLRGLLETIVQLSLTLPLVFPIHPRTQAKLNDFRLGEMLNVPRIIVLPPQGYFEMIGLLKNARLVLTDSGGVQEEATALGVACLTLRENTERPVTVEHGTNLIVGTDRDQIFHAATEKLNSEKGEQRLPKFWDGNAATRIIDDLRAWYVQTRKHGNSSDCAMCDTSQAAVLKQAQVRSEN